MSKCPEHESAKSLDQFYTSPEYAERFWQEINTRVDHTQADYWLEPSAGTGSFYDLLDPYKRIGIDLDPQHPLVIKQDFFDWQPPTDRTVFTIGNPPFGKNANLAIRFFNRAAEFSEIIAFVLPRTFRKSSVINRLDPFFHCVFDETVPENSFTYLGESYNVWCCAQIWERRTTKRAQREILRLDQFRDFFEIVEPDQADFAIQRVGGRAGLIRTQGFDSYSSESHYFFRQRDPRVLDCFQRCDWDRVKYNTVGNPSISPSELLELWQEQAVEAGLEITFGNGLFSQG